MDRVLTSVRIDPAIRDIAKRYGIPLGHATEYGIASIMREGIMKDLIPGSPTQEVLSKILER